MKYLDAQTVLASLAAKPLPYVVTSIAIGKYDGLPITAPGSDNFRISIFVANKGESLAELRHNLAAIKYYQDEAKALGYQPNDQDIGIVYASDPVQLQQGV